MASLVASLVLKDLMLIFFFSKYKTSFVFNK